MFTNFLVSEECSFIISTSQRPYWQPQMFVLHSTSPYDSIHCVKCQLCLKTMFKKCCLNERVFVFQTDQGDFCSCCSETPVTQCQEEKLVKISAAYACGTMRILLKVCVSYDPKFEYSTRHIMLWMRKIYSCLSVIFSFQKVLFALCALNALATAVCLVAAALRYLQIFSTRRPCIVRQFFLSYTLNQYTFIFFIDQCVM